MKKVLSLTTTLLLLVACHESYDERLLREAHNQTRINCPRHIDPYTILDSITYSPGHQEWSYHYRLVDSLDNESIITTSVVDNFRDHLLQNIVNNLELRQLKQKGITLVYSYRLASTGKEVIHEVFTKNDY